jgi:hypothetical protein
VTRGSLTAQTQEDGTPGDAGSYADFTADDLYQALVAYGLALRHRPKPNREDYDRRGRFLLDSLRPRP